VPWSEATVFFVPDRRHAGALEQEGVAPERIWLAEELLALLAGPPVTPTSLALLTAVKRAFAGEVVANQPSGEVSGHADPVASTPQGAAARGAARGNPHPCRDPECDTDPERARPD
jgi:hypothetical protein